MYQVNEYCMVLCLPQLNTIGPFHFPLFCNNDVTKHVTTVEKTLKMLRMLNYFCFVLQMVKGAKITLLLPGALRSEKGPCLKMLEFSATRK